MDVDLGAAVVILAVAAAAPLVADLSRARIPIVVVEILAGILIGPQVLGWVELSDLLVVFSQLGLTLLFFMAGVEIDFDEIRGRALNRAAAGWLVSFALALLAAAGLRAVGLGGAILLVTVALTTTAIGTLLPILRDSGEIGTPVGRVVLAVGAVGELFPIVAISLLLTQDADRLVTVVLLVAFAVATLTVAFVSARFRPARVVRVVERTMHASGQLAVRLAMLLLLLLVYLASEFGLDVVLGAFAAGIVAGLVVRSDRGSAAAKDFLHKMDAISFGFFIPIFFLVSGMKFDLDALLDAPAALASLPVYLALFLVVRGVPAVLFRDDVGRDGVLPLALYSATALPLVVAITDIGVQTARLGSDDAAALVGAAMVSVLVFPLVALRMRRDALPG